MKYYFLYFLILSNICVFSQGDYVRTIHQKTVEAQTLSQQIEAYQAWLPLAILIHDTTTKKALADFEKIARKNNSELARGIYFLNYAYFLAEHLGDYGKSLEVCIEAKAIFEKLNAKPQLVMTYNRLVFLILWNQIGKKDLKQKENLYEKYLAKALTMAKKLKNNDLEILTLGFIGSYYNVTEKDNKKALFYFFEAEKKLMPNTAPDLRVTILESLAIVFTDIHNETKIRSYLTKCEKETYFTMFGYGRSNMYRAISNFYLTDKKNKDLTKALFFAKKSYQISLAMNAPEYISQGQQRLYEVYKAMGDIKTALDFHEKHKDFEDSLARERFQRTYAEYDLATIETRIKSLENEKLQAEANKNITARNFLFFSLLVGLSIVAYVFWNNKNLKIKNEQLIYKNLEIEQALVKGQTIERKRMATELHDNLNSKLASIRWRLEALNTEKYAEIDRKIHSGVLQSLEDVYADVRLISHNLLPVELETKGLVAAIETLIQTLNLNTKTKFYLIADPIEPRLDAKLEYNLYSIVLELVNNVIKHAQASEAWVSLNRIKDKVSLTVSDNGKGLENAVDNDGVGIRNLHSRLEVLDGTLQIESLPRNGTKIKVEVLA